MPAQLFAEQFMADAAKLLTESLDYRTSIGRLAELAVPALADWCVIDLLCEDGESFDRVAVAHRGPRADAVATSLMRRYPLRREHPLSVDRAMLNQNTVLLRDLTEALSLTLTREQLHIEALEGLSVRSAMVVPLVMRARTIGALSLLLCERNFEERHAAFVGRLSSNIAAAVDSARLLAAEQRARGRVAKLHEVTAAMSRASTAEEVAAVACQIGKEALESHSAALWLAQPDGSLLLAGTSGTPSDFIENFRVIAAGTPGVPAMEVLRTGEPVWVETAADYQRLVPRYFEAVKAANRISAFGAVPITLGNQVGGVLVFSHAVDHVYDQMDRAFYATLAHHCSQALDRARLLDAERRSNARLRLLAEAGEALSSSLDLDQTLRSLAKLVVPAIADWCVVDLVEGTSIRRVAVENPDPLKVAESFARAALAKARVGDGSRIANVIAQARSHFHPRLSPSDIQAAARSEEELERLKGERLVSAIVVPLSARGECIGALSLITADSGRVYEQADVGFAEELGRRAGMAIANARLHRALAEANDRWRYAFTQAPMCIAIYVGEDLRIEFANPTYLAVRSRTPDIIGRSYADVFPEAVESNLALLQDVYREGVPRTFAEARTVLDRGDGPKECFFHVSLVALRSHDGEVDRLMSVSFEVTDAVLARRALDVERARLKVVFRQAPFPIGVFEGPEHQIVFANEKWEAMVGRALPSGQRLADAVPELREQNILPLHDRAFAGETIVGTDVALTLIVDNVPKPHFFHVIMHPLLASTGIIEGHVTMALDVTTQVLARGELETARSEAVAANRAKDEFLAMLGHELRNPLAPIVTALELLESRNLSGGQLELSIISRQVQHLTRLVDDLLDISRITRGKVELRKERVETSTIVARALETAGLLFEQRQVQLEILVPQRGLTVEADPSRMSQVIANLLTNAAKYTERGGHVSVTAERDQDQIVVRVVDDGIGIQSTMLQRIFAPFVQEQQGLDRSGGGLGLGLAIVKSFVDLHGGRVDARSDGPGRGSVFSVRLPASRISASEQAPPSRPAPPRARRTHHILVVDDNEDAAELLAYALEAIGHVTATAADGTSALLAFQDFPADVAILDIGLPLMDGYELAARLRTLDPELHLIALTGYGQASDRERALRAGFNRHLVKPVDLAQVLDALPSAEEDML
jgi:signal transduction histidine kinase/GAF domain-containing protein